MKKFLLICIPFLATFAFASPTLSVAVAPFSNLSGVKAQDYIGFQIAEFVSGGLAGYPGVSVVERGAIEAIIQEQELQLSGLTDEKGAVNIGGLANAAQMVVGSFTLDAKGSMSLTGRLVDVATSSVLGSTTVTGVMAPSPAPLYKDFVFKLLSSVKGYGMNVAVEGRLSTLSEEDASVSADYARALEASFRKNDEEARKYLEKVVQGGRLATSSYMDAAGRYQAIVSRLEGESIFAQLLRAQLSTNAELMAQVEPLTNYRNTLKALAGRVDGLLTPDVVELRVQKKEIVAMGTVSAVITLPDVALAIKDEARLGMAGLFEGQSFVVMGDTGIHATAAPPPGRLLSDSALSGLFDLSFNVTSSYSIVFHDQAGKELWRLTSKPRYVLRLDGREARYETELASAYSVAAPRDGWTLRPDGLVEIQTRAIKVLAGIRVELDRTSFRKATSFASSGDLRWKSLILHAYRKGYIKLAVANDPCPAVKDLIIADSYFTTADESLGRVPVIPADDSRAAYADLGAVVYFGDQVSTTVKATWSGVEKGSSQPYSGKLDNSSVLYFACPTSTLKKGAVSVTVDIGSDSHKKATISKRLGSGWERKTRSPTHVLLLAGKRLFAGGDSYNASGLYGAIREVTNSLYCIDPSLGTILWRIKTNAYSLVLVDGLLYVAEDDGVTSIDPARGSIRWKAPDGRGTDMLFDGGRLFSGGSALDITTGKAIWQRDVGRLLFGSSGKLFTTSGAFDPSTGNRLEKPPFEADFAILEGARVFAINNRGVSCLNPETGQVLWQNRRESANYLHIDGGLLFLLNEKATCALDPATGKELWKTETGGKSMLVLNGMLYISGGNYNSSISVLGALRGDLLWHYSGSIDITSMVADASGLYLGGDDGLARLDLSLVNRD